MTGIFCSMPTQVPFMISLLATTPAAAHLAFLSPRAGILVSGNLVDLFCTCEMLIW